MGPGRKPRRPVFSERGSNSDSEQSFLSIPDIHGNLLHSSFAGDLGLDGSQQKNLKILVHALYSNPKVLYAPNNTGVTTIIKKVRYLLYSIPQMSNVT